MRHRFFLSILSVLLFSCGEPSNEMKEKIELPQFAENCPTFDDGLAELVVNNPPKDADFVDEDSLIAYGIDGSNFYVSKINASISRPDEYSNEIKWNDYLVNASRLTIVYQSASDNIIYSFDVTGKESHMLKTGKVMDDMRIWNVKLQAEFNYLDGITIFNNELWNQHFRCGD